MNYRNGKPIGATILPGGGGSKVKHDTNTVFMTFEELEKTWKKNHNKEED